MLPKASHSHKSVVESLVPFEKHRPLTTVDYEQQLDYLSEWISNWDNTERFIFIEKLLLKCGKEQIQFLWTVLQPTLHRDFVFSSLSAESNSDFSPISIPVTREVHKHARSLKSKGKKVPFLKSAVLRNEEDVRSWTSQSVLPIMKSPSPSPASMAKFSFRGSPETSEATSGAWKSYQSYFGVRFPGIKKPHARSVLSIKSAPPTLGYAQTRHQAIRRHMQNKMRGEKRFDEVWKEESRPDEDRAPWKYYWSTLNTSFDSCPNYLTGHQLTNEEARIVLNWFAHGWNDWKRNEFLQTLLKILEPSELFYISGLISVCRSWNSVANDEHLWKQKCNEIFIGIPLNRAKHWKTVYKESMELKRNWSLGHCTSKEISGHPKRVLSVTAFENLIASGSYDKAIKIWDGKSGSLLQTLEGHSKGVWSLCFLSKTVLLSGSHDASIRVWNLRTSSCAKILISHTGPVWAMERKGDTLLSGSGDKTAKVWDIRQCRLVHTLVGHSASVFAVDVDRSSNRGFTGSADHTVRIWNLETGKCLKYFSIGSPGRATAVTSLSYDEGFVAVASGKSVSLWNVEGRTCTYELLGHVDRVEAVKLKLRIVRGKVEDGFIYSAGKDGLVKYWDFHDGKCVKTLRGHQASVNALFVDDHKIVSASEDNKVRIWNFLPVTVRQRKIEKSKMKPRKHRES